MHGELVFLSEGYRDGLHNVFNGILDGGTRAGRFQVEFRDFLEDDIRPFLFKHVRIDGRFKEEDGDVRCICGWIEEW